MPLKTTTAYQCPECQQVCTEEDALRTRLYTCGECGTTYNREQTDGPRCEQCNKFGERTDSKAGSKGKDQEVLVCPECENIELEETEVYPCLFCDQQFQDDDKLAEHLEEDHAGEVVEEWLADRAAPEQPQPKVLLDLLEQLGYYIYQVECEHPEQLLNPIHLWPGRDETMAEVEARNKALLRKTVETLAGAGRPLHVSVR